VGKGCQPQGAFGMLSRIMRDIDLFQLALGLMPPWMVQSSEFDPASKRLDICLYFPRGSTFACPTCGQEGLKAHDTVQKKWRHLNFFQHEAYLSAKVPRVRCKNCGSLRLVEVPWARPGSGFTLLFEAMIMTLAKAMPVKTLSQYVEEHDTRLWRIIHHYVEKGRDKADYSEVSEVGFDETSSKRGHNYVSLFVDLSGPRVMFATEGKDSSTVTRFKDDLTAHGGKAENIKQMCCDMSPAFIKGVEENFPDAELTFDKFHIMKVINEAVDQVRREEQKSHPELVRSRYLWLKNPQNLTKKQTSRLENLILKKLHLKTGRAYQIKLNFQEIFNQPPSSAEPLLKKWFFWATHSRLQPIIDAAYTIKRHWNGVLQWFKSRITNGVLEGINSLIQAAKARARGYRTNKNLIAMIYLISGKLNFGLPT
jgi:transposase